MADLKKFMWEGVRPGMPMTLYLNRWPAVGDGLVESIDTLYLKIKGKGSVLGFKFDLNVEVTMPDTSPVGRCKVKLNGTESDGCLYKVEGDTLVINHPEAQLKMKANDSKWTWLYTNHPVSVWVGAWPTGMAMADEDYFGEIE